MLPRRAARSRRPLAAATVALATTVALAAPSCGARTSLPTPTPPAPAIEDDRSAAFCASADYRSGTTETSLLLVLDKSGSMQDDGKWDQVTAAIAAFVDAPENAGLAMGLVVFPLGVCDPARYATPAVPLGFLPANAPAIKAKLAAITPDGDTPTLPVLQGTIEYARALALADPARSVVIALATDGAPNTCDSTAQRVADVARAGATTDPPVLTFVIGVLTGYVGALERIAEGGGTGRPIFLTDAETSAQEFSGALRYLRDTQAACRFALPATGAAAPRATDLAVRLAMTPGAPPVDLPVVASLADCRGEAGFFPDDLDHPTRVTLCPASCDAAHGSTSSRVTVIAGCGAGAGDAGVPGDPDAGACGGAVTFGCVAACGVTSESDPVCVNGDWACPAGLVSTDTCTTCPPVPHGCCKPDGTFAAAACLSGTWTCAPGSTLFGTGACAPPTVCSRALPCALGQICEVPDFACGDSAVLGRCAPRPDACGGGGPAVCGCDGSTYASRCAAEVAGVDVTSTGSCLAPPGTFACGPLFCDATSEVCQRTTDLQKAVAASAYACLPSTPACPSGCGCGACACPPGRLCKEACNTTQAGHRFLVCTEL